MFVRRLTTSFKEQHWMTLVIELVIVIVGVFIGTWVANRNQEVVERESTIRLLNQFKSEIQFQAQEYQALKDYMAVTGDYARVAEAGWRNDPSVSDRDFVIAAYQASQIYGFNNNGASWALVFGASDLRNIPDPKARQALTRLMTFDYSTINIAAVQTRYRDHVREVIPDSVQQQIRKGCGDVITDGFGTVLLPADCPIQIDPALAAATSAELRRDRTLAPLLGQHRSLVSAYLTNLALFEAEKQALAGRIAKL